jgi:hypothetical protein
MSVNVFQSIGPFMFACFAEYRREFCPDGKISQKLWEEKCEDFHAAWHRANDPKKVKRAAKTTTDEEWIAALESDPANAGLNVRQELGRANFWARENHRICTRRFFANWLLKAERNVDAATNMHAPRKPAAAPDLSNYRQMTDDERAKSAELFQQLATGKTL